MAENYILTSLYSEFLTNVFIKPVSLIEVRLNVKNYSHNFFFKCYFSMVFIQICRVHQMLTNISINILVQTDERTHVFKRKESSPRKSMYVIIQTISAERLTNKGINKVTR